MSLYLTYHLFSASPQQHRFNQMSSSIIGRIDEMGNRIDDLESSITEVRTSRHGTYTYRTPRTTQRVPISTILYSFYISKDGPGKVLP